LAPFTGPLCQAVGVDSTHARCTSVSKYAGTPAPSQSFSPPSASRLSGGVVRITYAAARPADARSTWPPFAPCRSSFGSAPARPTGRARRAARARAARAAAAWRMAAARLLRGAPTRLFAAARGSAATVARRARRRSGRRARGRTARRPIRGGAGRIFHVALRFVSALRKDIPRLVVHLFAPIGPAAGDFCGALVLIRRRGGEIAGLFGNLVAKLRSGFRGEQHAQTCAEHRAREKSHHKAAAPPTFVVETIVSVFHDPSC